MSIGHPPIGDPGGVNPAGVPAPDQAPGWPTPPTGAMPGYPVYHRRVRGVGRDPRPPQPRRQVVTGWLAAAPYH
jgi:hypothetical protein